MWVLLYLLNRTRVFTPQTSYSLTQVKVIFLCMHLNALGETLGETFTFHMNTLETRDSISYIAAFIDLGCIT